MGIDGGDSDFDEFFRALLPRTVAVARRITGDRATAEDVAVEALAKAHVRWGRVRLLPWRDAWVLRVASREALRHLPKGPPAMAPAPATTDASDAVALRMALVAALRRLPTRQREVIALRYLCDLPEAEVAKALGVSPGAVKTHLHRGIATLRSTTGTDFEEHEHELSA